MTEVSHQRQDLKYWISSCSHSEYCCTNQQYSEYWYTNPSLDFFSPWAKLVKKKPKIPIIWNWSDVSFASGIFNLVLLLDWRGMRKNAIPLKTAALLATWKQTTIVSITAKMRLKRNSNDILASQCKALRSIYVESKHSIFIFSSPSFKE